MSLSSAVEAFFSRNARARGTEYFDDGAVVDLRPAPDAIHAIVEGTDDYDVAVALDGATMHVSCTCPHFVGNRLNCKHIWATLLAADAAQLEPNAVPVAVVAAPAETAAAEMPERDLFGPRPAPLGAPSPAAQRRPAAKPRPEPPPLWRLRLAEILGGADAARFGRDAFDPESLLYVVDAAASQIGDAVIVELMTRERKANGEWGKPRAVRIPEDTVRRLTDGPDREILERLLGGRAVYEWSPYTGAGELARIRLDGVLARELLQAMCATGRCLARIPAHDATPTAKPDPARAWESRPKPPPIQHVPLSWDASEPWRLLLSIRRDEAERSYVIDGRFQRQQDRMTVTEPLVVSRAGVVVTRTHVARLDHGGAAGWIRQLQSEAVRVPFDARSELVSMLAALEPPVDERPPELHVEIERPTPRATLRLVHLRNYGQDRYEGLLLASYDGFCVEADVPNLLLSNQDATRIIRRDFAAERGFAADLQRAGFRQEWSPRRHSHSLQISGSRLPSAIRTLLAQHWMIEADGTVYRHPSATAMHVSSGIDWFELTAYVDYGGVMADLPALLSALKRGDSFVPLPDGTMGLVPEEWLRKHGLIARVGTVDGQRVRFRKTQTALLDALLAAQPDATSDELFERARNELRDFDGIAPADPPSSFTGTLRSYQRDGLGWLLFLRRFGFGGCLADDMGLGKTVMVLALLAYTHGERSGSDARPSLVVAPRSLVFNWMREAERFAPDLRVLEYTGTGRAAQRTNFAAHDLVLTTYGTLRRDAAHLAGVDFEYLVLDEAQAIKNAASASAKAARLLRGSHRLALSGTPVENHLGELWSLFEFLNPGLLGSAAAFESAGRSLDDEAVAMLARGLRPFILRRTKEQVAPELPVKTEQTIFCELERPQRLLYNQLRDHYRAALLARVDNSGLGRSKLQVLEALLRLRQAACHPALIDPARRGDAAAKLDVLVPRVAEVVEEGHKALVFSQFTSLLALLRERLDADGVAYEYLDGRTRDRQAKVDRFQKDPGCRVFLVSLKAGGLGLNLTAAEYVFLLDPWWNPAVEAQAVDRAHRIGQTEHVFAYRLIAKDTVEERVLELQQQKKALADAILAADESLIRTLRREDLELLLS